MGSVSVWEDEKVQEIDGGGDCITMQMYLMPLNCSCIFYCNKKYNFLFSYNINHLLQGRFFIRLKEYEIHWLNFSIKERNPQRRSKF